MAIDAVTLIQKELYYSYELFDICSTVHEFQIICDDYMR